MFSGIIESLGKIALVERDQSNVVLTIESHLAPELKVDQSVAHNGICLTVVEINQKTYRVVAIEETIDKTTIGSWKSGELVNLERCVALGHRLDGHIVQGHVDTKGTILHVEILDGSWKFTIAYDSEDLTVPKGSIAINGVSLTVVDSQPGQFSVCIIPYTYEHTCFKTLAQGHPVNLEFDIIGKYVAAHMKHVQLPPSIAGS